MDNVGWLCGMVLGLAGWTEFSGCRCVAPCGCMIMISFLFLVVSFLTRPRGRAGEDPGVSLFPWVPALCLRGALLIVGGLFFGSLWFVINWSCCMGDEGTRACWRAIAGIPPLVLVLVAVIGRCWSYIPLFTEWTLLFLLSLGLY